MDEADYLIVGSGINALVCAALLGRKGRKVLVLERNDRIGGCIRTEAVTLPGFVHDVMATTFVLFVTSPAYAALGPELERRGVVFAQSERPTGVLRPDGGHLVLTRDRAANIVAFDRQSAGDGGLFDREMQRFGANAQLAFGLLGGALWSWPTVRLLLREARRRGPRDLLAYFGAALAPARAYLETTYRSEIARDLFAPWVLHCGLGPESAYGAEMAKIIGFALEAAGAPIVKGGAQSLLQAFDGLIRDQGGRLEVEADVESIQCSHAGRADSVTLTDGRTFTGRRGVICSVSPDQLYGRFLKGSPAAERVAEPLASYRWDKGNMQVHYALSAPPNWIAPDLCSVALLHLTPGLDGVSRACNECERGLLPAEPTICVGQPSALDPSRAPPGQAVLWLQLPETPRRLKGDAAGAIAVPEDGLWTTAVREAYADRIEAILEARAPGFRSLVLARRAYSPADLEALNINLVGGDPYGGSCGLDQFLLWRPFKESINHRTSIPGLYHIGASTHPGPGLGGGSGFLLAQTLR